MITVSTYFTYDITFLFSYLKFKNSFSGNFMMVDVTSHTNSDAAMSSAPVSQNGQRQYCLSFWFSMNGPSVHMLAVYVYFLSADGMSGNMLSSETGRSFTRVVIFLTFACLIIRACATHCKIIQL